MDPHTPVGKSEWVVHEQNRSTSHDNTGVCMFVGAAGGPLESLVPCVAAAWGVPYTVDDFVEIGERTWNLERLFNLKAGLTKADDTLPQRLLKEPHRAVRRPASSSTWMRCSRCTTASVVGRRTVFQRARSWPN
jgi:aldehyde:ferredoxin oxidoreductase